MKDFLEVYNRPGRNNMRYQEFHLKGDIEEIKHGLFDVTTIMLMLDNTQQYSFGPGLLAKLYVPGDLVESVKNELKPCMNLECIGLYIESTDFKLTKILNTSNELMFPYCVCDSCGRNYTNSADGYMYTCPICGAKTRFIDDVYSKEDTFVNHVRKKLSVQ